MGGFLPGSRAPLVPDLIVVALLAVVPLLLAGVALAGRGRTRAHHAVMWWTYHLLAAVVVAFVIWNAVAGTRVEALETWPYYGTIYRPLIIGHIIIAVAAVVLAGRVAWRGRARRIAREDGELAFDPDEAARHRRSGRFALGLLLVTAGSGLVIYWFRYLREYG